MKNYLRRSIEPLIERKLGCTGAVLVTGPKFCGKTTTCKRFAKSSISFIDGNIIDIASADPRGALEGKLPRLIDEWQCVPQIWNYIRQKVDEDQNFGEYILTGSSTPADPSKITHSGAGRISKIKMRPMSLAETGESKGRVSLKELFDNPSFAIFDENEGYGLAKTAFFICRGGWPLSLQENEQTALDVTRSYYDGLFNFVGSDNPLLAGKNPKTMRLLLKSYARHISTQAAHLKMYNDLVLSGKVSMDKKTFDSYVSLASDMFLIEDMDAWTPTLRSKAAIRTAPTRHFVDTSIAAQSLAISPADLLKDARSFGLFFEDFAIKELRVYADALDGEVYHYRDSDDLECDAILHLHDGRYGAIEIKLGSPEGIEEGAKSLLKLSKKLSERESRPSFNMILTATGVCHKRPDGIYVVPINMLRD